MYAAGAYPNLDPGGDGLPRWTEADRPLVGQDVILWYTLGLNHTPRPEQWPVMTFPPHRIRACALRLLFQEPGAGRAEAGMRDRPAVLGRAIAGTGLGPRQEACASTLQSLVVPT